MCYRTKNAWCTDNGYTVGGECTNAYDKYRARNCSGRPIPTGPAAYIRQNGEIKKIVGKEAELLYEAVKKRLKAGEDREKVYLNEGLYRELTVFYEIQKDNPNLTQEQRDQYRLQFIEYLGISRLKPEQDKELRSLLKDITEDRVTNPVIIQEAWNIFAKTQIGSRRKNAEMFALVAEHMKKISKS